MAMNMTGGDAKSTTVDSTATGLPSAAADPRRWKALIVLGLIQFILVVDVTVTNVALPQIKQDLGFTNIGLTWVAQGYVIMAGGLLLLGGRLSDIYGRRRLFLLGVTVFALGSIASGAASSPGMLVTGRFVQGIGEALAQPASLGLIALLFPDHNERVKAIGIWGGIAGLAGVSGVIGSGVLTELASWRWIFYINIPIALLTLVLLPILISESKMVRQTKRLDVTGAVTLVAGVIAIVYGLLQVVSYGWASGRVLVPLLGGLVLLGIMIAVESRVDDPLIPLRFYRNRTRVVANLAGLFFSASFFSFFFIMTLFVQQVQDTSPLQTGLRYSPLGISMIIGIGLCAGMMPKFGARNLLAVGFFIAAVSLLLASRLTVDSPYLSGLLPVFILMGFGAGVVMPAGTTAALHQVTGQDTGLGSGMHTTVHQVGAGLGLACFGALALRHAATEVADGVDPDVAATNGFTLAFTVAAIALIICGLLIRSLMERVGGGPRNALAEIDVTHEDVLATTHPTR